MLLLYILVIIKLELQNPLLARKLFLYICAFCFLTLPGPKSNVFVSPSKYSVCQSFYTHPKKKHWKNPYKLSDILSLAEEYFRRQSNKRCLKRILVKIVNIFKLMSNQSFEKWTLQHQFWSWIVTFTQKKEKPVDFPNISELLESKVVYLVYVNLEDKYDAH